MDRNNLVFYCVFQINDNGPPRGEADNTSANKPYDLSMNSSSSSLTSTTLKVPVPPSPEIKNLEENRQIERTSSPIPSDYTVKSVTTISRVSVLETVNVSVIQSGENSQNNNGKYILLFYFTFFELLYNFISAIK